MRLIKVRGCADTEICPAVYVDADAPHVSYVQGKPVTDPALLSHLGVPNHECLTEIPTDLIADLPGVDA
jgi:hypothetical protein